LLNPSWNGTALPALTSQLGVIIAAAPNVTLISGGSIDILSPGLSNSATVAVTPQNGFTGTVSLSCSVSGGSSGASYLPTCTVPSTENITGTAAVNATVTVTTTGSSASSARHPLGIFSRAVGGAALASLLLIGFPARRRKMLLPVLILMAAAFTLSACGGGSQTGTTSVSTPTGNYTVTVTGTATGLNPVTVQIPLSVQ
jgi:hypothetical protein